LNWLNLTLIALRPSGRQAHAKADYERAMAELHQAEAAVKISEGALKAQVELARCAIYAPVDGSSSRATSTSVKLSPPA
jgi:multidrug resistance efflux pump